MLVCADLGWDRLAALAARYGVRLVEVAPGDPIPGSYWGEPEAGIVAGTLQVRGDTPVHSYLHELGHIVCADAARRSRILADAGGDDLEECGVCRLQLLLADELEGVGARRLAADMDAWGYSFRLGTTWTWFEEDSRDAREWLAAHGLTDRAGRPTFASRR